MTRQQVIESLWGALLAIVMFIGGGIIANTEGVYTILAFIGVGLVAVQISYKAFPSPTTNKTEEKTND